jgi:hypothetical protein
MATPVAAAAAKSVSSLLQPPAAAAADAAAAAAASCLDDRGRELGLWGTDVVVLSRAAAAGPTLGLGAEMGLRIVTAVWQCLPSYVTRMREGSWVHFSTCFLTVQPGWVHL